MASPFAENMGIETPFRASAPFVVSPAPATRSAFSHWREDGWFKKTRNDESWNWNSRRNLRTRRIRISSWTYSDMILYNESNEWKASDCNVPVFYTLRTSYIARVFCSVFCSEFCSPPKGSESCIKDNWLTKITGWDKKRSDQRERKKLWDKI